MKVVKTGKWVDWAFEGLFFGGAMWVFQHFDLIPAHSAYDLYLGYAIGTLPLGIKFSK